MGKGPRGGAQSRSSTRGGADPGRSTLWNADPSPVEVVANVWDDGDSGNLSKFGATCPVLDTWVAIPESSM